jgi:hypothetical protein
MQLEARLFNLRDLPSRPVMSNIPSIIATASSIANIVRVVNCEFSQKVVYIGMLL